MSKYNLIITQEPGALFMRVVRGSDGADVWRGRCVPDEKLKMTAEAMAEITGKPLRDLFQEKHRFALDDADGKGRKEHAQAWQSGKLSELIAEVINKHSGDFRIVDLTEGG